LDNAPATMFRSKPATELADLNRIRYEVYVYIDTRYEVYDMIK